MICQIWTYDGEMQKKVTQTTILDLTVLRPALVFFLHLVQ